MPSVRAVLPEDRPTRILATATLVNTFGNGLFFTASVVYLTHVIGLSAGQVGVGLTLAGIAGVVAGVPAGHLGDRLGAREVLAALTLLSAFLVAAFAWVGGFATYLVVVVLYALADRGAGAVRQALVAAVSPEDGRVRTRAYLRAVTNVGLGLGSLFAGVALAMDSKPAYVTLIALDAVTFAACAALLMRLPHQQSRPRDVSAPRLPVFRDRPYLLFCLLLGVITVQFVLLEVGIPLWVTRDTEAPTWTIALVFFVNTLVVALFQVKASHGTEEVLPAALVVRRSGVVLLVACAVFAAAGWPGAVVAVAVLVAGALVHVLGEMRQSAGSWGVAFGLAPDHLQGQYQGLFTTAFSLSQVLGPLLIVGLPITFGGPGWIALGLIFAGASAAVVPVARWGERTRVGVA